MDQEDKDWDKVVSSITLRDKYDAAMDQLGFVVIAEDGFVVRKFRDGRKEIISEIESSGKNLKLD